MLEAGGILEIIPHAVDPAAKLTTAAIAMRRSDSWFDTVGIDHPCRGNYIRYRKPNERGTYSSTYHPVNQCSGEIPWR